MLRLSFLFPILAAFQLQSHAAIPEAFRLKLSGEIKQGCLALEQPWRSRCVLRIAASLNSSEVCDFLSAGDRSRCTELALGHESFCAGLGEGERKECWRDWFRGHLAKMAEVRGSEIRSRDMRFRCMENTGDGLRSECAAFLATDNAIVKIKPVACDELAQKTQREECLERVFDRAQIGKSRQLGCNGLSNPNDKIYCEAVTRGRCAKNSAVDCVDRLKARRAVESRRRDLCDEIRDGAVKSNCLENVYVKLALHTIHELNAQAAVDILTQLKPQAPSEAAGVQVPAARAVESEEVFQSAEVSIRAFKTVKRSPAKTPFIRHEGSEFGLNLPPMRASELWRLANLGRGLAAGDINGDGWTDLVFATREGPKIYRNLGGMKFALQEIKPALKPAMRDTIAVALVDLNGDGKLDLVYSNFTGEAQVLLNRDGEFSAARALDIPRQRNSGFVRAIGFADLNGDGRLDLYLGNWTPVQSLSVVSASELFLNRGAKFSRVKLNDRTRGQSFSALFSRLLGTSETYLVMASNLSENDETFRFTKDAKPVAANELFPDHRGTSSYDSGDLNGDLKLDVVAIARSLPKAEPASACAAVQTPADKNRCQLTENVFEKLLGGNVQACDLYTDAEDKRDCAGYVLALNAKRSGHSEWCNKISESTGLLLRRCLGDTGELESAVESKPRASSGARNQAPTSHIFIQQDGRFSDKTDEWSIGKTGWAWGARLGDVNNDGWLDLFVASGAAFMNQPGSSFLLLNNGGKNFSDRSAESGVKENFSSSSFIFVDLDNSGSLDIVANAANGPLRVFLNHGQNNSVTIELRAKGQNTRALGALIKVESSDGTKQIREVKSSGGYLSFDAPLTHFGLGQATAIAKLEVQWPDAKVTKIDHTLPANRHYVIQEK